MLILSSSITEILAWFNLDGYVFEILPFMNKNLFEILVDRQFAPFDVCLAAPRMTTRQKRFAFFSDRWFPRWERCTTAASFTPTSSPVCVAILCSRTENVMFYPVEDEKQAVPEQIPVIVFPLVDA